MSFSASQWRPLISVIVASYNYEEYIGLTLKSILDQTEGDFEVIVVDDGSTDRSCEVVRSFSDQRVRLFVNDRNLGVTRTYNRGASLASGTYITYLDADDWIDPRKFELQIGWLSERSDVDVLGTYADFRSSDGSRHPKASRLEKRLNQPHDLNNIDRWAGGNLLVGSSVMLRRSTHGRIGLRDPGMTTADFELWTRALGCGMRLYSMQIPLLFHRLHDRSANKLRSPEDALFELSFAVHQNILPRIKTTAAFRIAVDKIVRRMRVCAMEQQEQYRHLALLLSPSRELNFIGFKTAFLARSNDTRLIAEGKEWHQGLRLSDVADRRDFDSRIEDYLARRP